MFNFGKSPFGGGLGALLGQPGLLQFMQEGPFSGLLANRFKNRNPVYDPHGTINWGPFSGLFDGQVNGPAETIIQGMGAEGAGAVSGELDMPVGTSSAQAPSLESLGVPPVTSEDLQNLPTFGGNQDWLQMAGLLGQMGGGQQQQLAAPPPAMVGNANIPQSRLLDMIVSR